MTGLRHPVGVPARGASKVGGIDAHDHADRDTAALGQGAGVQQPQPGLEHRVMAALTCGPLVRGPVLGGSGCGQGVEDRLPHRFGFVGELSGHGVRPPGPPDRVGPVAVLLLIAGLDTVRVQTGQQQLPRTAQRTRVLMPRGLDQERLCHPEHLERRRGREPTQVADDHIHMLRRDLTRS